MATTKKSVKKTYSTKSGKKSATPPAKRWSAKVDTDSTHPDHGLFLESAPKIAKALATKRVSPKGPASGMQMLNFYINRAGKNLPKERLATLRHAKELLSAIIEQKKEKSPAKKSPAKKSSAKKSA
jgi:Protein of unknown function (DUF3175)